eukprot:CAMPEP_0194507194 /NCGR_PEP_ID=MMETSP0253-20130528/36392_1 /TAXON_ID=2966 /ORGANISM="Noctiluca scintillans" /LENGTH=94 /DNA_ID=CAMNT_0039350045 /DNA_START=273 /DNA_END=554 /DNA_ORIENTATION=-
MGLTKYSHRCLSDQTMPDLTIASEYSKPSHVPATRPITPKRGGPCLFGPPSRMLWQDAHLDLNSCAPLSISPCDTSTTGSGAMPTDTGGTASEV